MAKRTMMTDVTVVALALLSAFMCVCIFLVYKLAMLEYKRGKQKIAQQEDALVCKWDVVETDGLFELNRKELLASGYYLNLKKYIANKGEQIPAMYVLIDKLQPYEQKDLYAILRYIRNLPESSPELIRAYKTHATASALLFDFKVPRALLNTNTAVLYYVASYELRYPTCNVVAQLRKYIQEDESSQSADDVFNEHSEIQRLEADLVFANKFFCSTVLPYDVKPTIVYLYSRWLDQHGINPSNYRFYKDGIDNFKKLATLYFGLFDMDVPKTYLFVNTALCEYVLQLRRYSPASGLRVVK